MLFDPDTARNVYHHSLLGDMKTAFSGALEE
ncbi:hypothetical protein AVEN_273486-1, partial [Araneus ventricosus]